MRRILCIHLPNWPMQRLLAANRGLDPARPIILHALGPRQGELVAACNAAAHKCGVRPLMPLAEAAALVQGAGVRGQGSGVRSRESGVTGQMSSAVPPKSQIPNPKSLPEPRTLNPEPYDPAADLAALARLAEHCERFSPIVGWETAEGGAGPRPKVQSPKLSPDFGPSTLDVGLFLDVTGIGALFGGEAALAREVVGDLAAFGYEVHVAVADTIGAAWAAAVRSGAGSQGAADERQRSEVGSQARGDSTPYSVLGTEYSVLSPAITILTPFCTPHSDLGICPCSVLRLPPETLDLLTQLGITRLEQLLALPRSSLRARFGERLLLRLDQFLGTAPETIVAHRPPPEYVAEQILEYPTESRALVECLVQDLVANIAAALAANRQGAVRLACRLDCAPGRPLIFEVGLFRPSADPQHLWDVVRLQWEQRGRESIAERDFAIGENCFRNRLPTPSLLVGRVTLAAPLVAPLENRQAELFAGSRHEAARQWELLMDRLASRLGPAAVLSSKLTADPLPERAVRYERFMSRRVSGRRDAYPTMGATHRPLLIRQQPLALEVVSIVPDGPPIAFRLEGTTHQAARWWGPERIESGWWRGKSVRRDYYRVETATGERYWLFRQLRDGQWYLHGEFA